MLRVIGDVHGKVGAYSKLTRKAEYSVQVGDMGFKEEYKFLSRNVNPCRHKFVPGNHDDYDNLPFHSLGNFGLKIMGGITFFFVRGEYSIDKDLRIPGVDWWPQEELFSFQGKTAIQYYTQCKPSVMITHGCLESVMPHLLDRIFQVSSTAKLLEQLLEIHRPDLWIFGHYHKSWRKDIAGTQFICLDELEHIDLQ